MSRGAWILGGLGLGFIVLLLLWMGKTLDTKAPIRIDRVRQSAPSAPRTLSPEEIADRDESEMRLLVQAEAAVLSTRAASQIFVSDEVGRAECSFTGASPVHRDGVMAWWNAEFSCVDRQRPGALPNLTTVSVRLRKDGARWVVEN
ncbi:MAG: hypothetical protein WCC53_07700 [Thermoanaerobaculia bacterium]